MCWLRYCDRPRIAPDDIHQAQLPVRRAQRYRPMQLTVSEGASDHSSPTRLVTTQETRFERMSAARAAVTWRLAGVQRSRQSSSRQR